MKFPFYVFGIASLANVLICGIAYGFAFAKSDTTLASHALELAYENTLWIHAYLLIATLLEAALWGVRKIWIDK